MAIQQFDTEKNLLEAVNVLLETINELPIELAEDYDNVLEARQARAKIIEVKRAVLSEKWDVNSDKDWILALEDTGMIAIPANVLDISGGRGDLINRDWRLYSKKSQSHIFTEEQKCDVVWDLDFNSLSHPIRHYITIRAARIFAARTIGDGDMVKFNEVDEEDARLAARRSEGRTGTYNMLGSTYGINNLARIS